MKSHIRLVFLSVTAALLACNISSSVAPEVTPAEVAREDVSSIPTNEPTLTFTPADTPTRTPFPTATPSSGPTFTPTATLTDMPQVPTSISLPSNTPSITPTKAPSTAAPPTAISTATTQPPPPPPPPPSGQNLFQNPGFEGNFRPVEFQELNIFEGWYPFYCAEPYVSRHCPDPSKCDIDCDYASGKGRPEYKPATLSYRVHGGQSAQQWFCTYWPCRGGIYQTISTAPGQTCEVGAYIQAWSSNDQDLPSELDTVDDRRNATWRIMVDPYGGINAFDKTLLKSRVYGYDDGIYDQFIRVSLTFTAKSNQATVFFYDYRLWGFINNDSFVDDAFARCQ